MAAIEIQNLVKSYEHTRAVDNLSMSINDGELLVLLGPSGCGKTTTMNCIAGLELPTSGQVLFDGADVTEMLPHQRNIAMVFQSSTLYPHLTARKNIAMSLHYAGLDRSEIARRVEKAAETLNITKLLDKLPSQFSGGERQRVATAKAIIRHPKVFLLDEPLASIDAALRLTLRAELTNLQMRLGTTMIIVTHDQTEAMTMGDRIAVMRSGQLEQIGTPDEIYAHPATRFVAGFVGSPPMNLMDGELVSDDRVTRFVSGQIAVPLPGNPPQVKNGGFTLGIRPEDLILVDVGAPSAIRASIYAVEHLGRESILVTELKDGTRFRVVTERGVAPRIGELVGFVPRAGATLHLFDSQTSGQPAIARVVT